MPTEEAVPAVVTEQPEQSLAEYRKEREGVTTTQPEVTPVPAESQPTEPSKTAAVSETADLESESTEEVEGLDKDGKPQSSYRKLQRRIDEITRGRGEAERRAEQTERENKELRSKLAEYQKPPSPTPQPVVDSDKPPTKPKQADFPTWEEYDAAKDKYVEELAEYKSRKAVQDFRADQERQLAQREAARLWKEGRERHSDFDERVNPVLEKFINDPQVPMVLKEYVDRSPVVLDLLHALGRGNVDELVKLAKTDPRRAMRELVLLEEETIKSAAVSAESPVPSVKSSPKPVEKPVSSAPTPITPVGGGTAPTDMDSDEAIDKMSVHEYRKRRDARR